MTTRLVIGLGNPWRGDDGAGLAVARRLRAAVARDVRVVEHESEPTRLIDEWAGSDEVVVVDAVRSGAPPGTVHRLDPLQQPIPAELSRGSTHAFGLAETVELSRSLDRLPKRLAFYGIEGADFTAGSALAPAVSRAVERLSDELAGRFGPEP